MSTNGWKEVVRRGQFGLIAMSCARARVVGAQLHPDAEVVAELRPDDGPPLRVCFSMDGLLSFISELQPRTLTIETAPGEDRAALERELMGPGAACAMIAPGAALH